MAKVQIMLAMYSKLSVSMRFLGPMMWLSLLVFLACGWAAAHQLGEGYVMLDVAEDGISGRVEVTLEELDQLFDMDADMDGKLSDDEFLAHHEEATAYVFERFALGSEDAWFPLNPTEVTTESYPLGRYAFFHFEVAEPIETPQLLRLRYEVMFDQDPRHRGLLIVERNALTGEMENHERISLIFRPDEPVQTLDLLETSVFSALGAFTWHGMWHIWIGIDHIFFLAVLLLQSVLLHRDQKWHPVGGFKPALWNVAKIVTLFTIAHSITLSLAALGIVDLPPRLVESIIAASIVVAAIFNFFPATARFLPVIIFLFGLFHGFGFASVLGHLTTRAGSLLPALFGFNIGVEIGQLLIVCIIFPLLYSLRSFQFYRPVVLKAGSGAIAVIACAWFVERAFNVGPILGF